MASLACSTPHAPVTLQVYTWWQAPSELRAFDSVINYFESTHEGVTVENIAPSSSATDTRNTLSELLLADAPPASFQANIGDDLLRWTAVDVTQAGLPTNSRITELGELFDRTGLRANLTQPVLDQLMRGTHGPYAVPVNVHRLNVIYYNNKLLPRAPTLEELCPSNVESLLGDANNKPPVSIVFSRSDGPWPMTLLAFENLLPAVYGSQFYEDLFLGKQPVGWQANVSHVFSCVAYMARASVGSEQGPVHFPSETSWVDAAAAVADGNAQLLVMGDWVRGQLKDALGEQGTVTEALFPGTEQKFVFTSDTFPLPSVARHPAEAMALLETLASTAGQSVFSDQKGSIPARTDAPLGSVPNAQTTRTAFTDDQVDKLVATSGLFPPYYTADQVNNELANLVADDLTFKKPQDLTLIDDALAEFASQVPLFETWQARLAREPAVP